MSEGFDYVIVGAGSAGMRAGRASDRGSGRPRGCARGRRRGLPARDPHPGRVPGAVQVELRLGPRGRARAGARQPPPVPPPRQDARRLQLDQRDDLHPRQPRRLRRVGRRRLHGLGLRRGAAVLQALGGQRARRGRLPRGRRADVGVREPLDAPDRRHAAARPRSRPDTSTTRISTAPARRASAASS